MTLFPLPEDLRPIFIKPKRRALFEAGLWFGLGLACVWGICGATGWLVGRALSWALS